MFDLMELTEMDSAGTFSASNSVLRVITSAASPATVDVAWASMKPTEVGLTPASSYPRFMQSICPLGLGAVMLLAPASELLPTPRIRARMRSLTLRASSRRLSTRMPAPSAMTKPLADASKGQVWSGESVLVLQNLMKDGALMFRSTPPVRTMSDWRECREWIAADRAARLDAQAASTV